MGTPHLREPRGLAVPPPDGRAPSHRPPGGTPPTDAELSEAGEEFWAAVRSLPQRQAQSAALRYVYDMPVAEIAATLGCSEGTVKQHLSRARHSLAVCLAATTQEEL